MSTNAKNIVRPEFLKNFTTKIKRRYLIVESGRNSSFDYQSVINEINTTVNQIIQEINLRVSDRQIPYITLIAQYSTSLNERSRIVLHDQNSSPEYRERARRQAYEIGDSLSHCVDLLVCEGYKEIKISSLEYDAEIVVGRKFIICAITDLLLDIALFNSYSFLKERPLLWKHNFSFEKYGFARAKELGCYYEYKTSKKLYYSFAFSARKSENDFDVEEYIGIWDDFISHRYGNNKHCEKSIIQQLQQHVDYKELPASLVKTLQSYPVGAYLILRTNKARTRNLQPSICAAFGLEENEKGKIKIVPITEYEQYKPMLENLDVSAFKVVITEGNKAPSNITCENTMSVTRQQDCSVSTKRFKIALSFPGEYRNLVDAVASRLANKYGKEAILYDWYCKSEFARPNLDVYLQKLYKEDSELIVVFVCAHYDRKKWCGIEWRAIRSILNNTNGDNIMLIKCGEDGLDSVDGLDSSTDGYIDASAASPESLAENIFERFDLLASQTGAFIS